MLDLVVVGLGYVGLPLAVEAARSGLQVAGLDHDEATVAALSQGRSHIGDITNPQLAQALSLGFTPVSDPDVLKTAAAIVICVPTPLHGQMPDLSMVEEATRTIGARLQPNQLVVLESTTYPGTTEDVVLPILEAESGLTGGTDFLLAFSPERIDPGNEKWAIRNTPKIVSGIDPASAQRAVSLYEHICDVVVPVTGTREAEMAKLLENTYRHVNIALVNEMAVFCDELGIDIWEVIAAAATKPFGFEAFFPGPGVGGHCIPVDPNYLSFRVRELGYQFRFVELAQEINERMPRYVVDRIAALLNEAGKPVKGSRVLLLGIAYKPNTADLRESPALDVADLLAARGAAVSVSDPVVGSSGLADRSLVAVGDPIAAAGQSDVVVILTPHDAFDLEAIVAAAPAVLDTRGVTEIGTAERL